MKGEEYDRKRENNVISTSYLSPLFVIFLYKIYVNIAFLIFVAESFNMPRNPDEVIKQIWCLITNLQNSFYLITIIGKFDTFSYTLLSYYSF